MVSNFRSGSKEGLGGTADHPAMPEIFFHEEICKNKN